MYLTNLLTSSLGNLNLKPEETFDYLLFAS